MHFTVRWMMAVVAIAAILIWLAMIAPPFLATVLDDAFYGAEKKITNEWDAGPAPKVNVDLFAGYIDVVQSIDGRVSAVMKTSAIFKNSQDGADAAVNGITISAAQEGDTVRIRSANPRNMPAFSLRTDVELHVPPGASLDLLTGEGYVHIGQCLGGPKGNEWVSRAGCAEVRKGQGFGRRVHSAWRPRYCQVPRPSRRSSIWKVDAGPSGSRGITCSSRRKPTGEGSSTPAGWPVVRTHS